MNKDTKRVFLILLLVVIFVLGLKTGENHTIRHQKIEKTEYGYQVDFDGEIYDYIEN